MTRQNDTLVACLIPGQAHSELKCMWQSNRFGSAFYQLHAVSLLEAPQPGPGCLRLVAWVTACALVVCQVRPTVSAIVRVAQTGSKKILVERRGADLRAPFSASGWCILAACSRKLELQHARQKARRFCSRSLDKMQYQHFKRLFWATPHDETQKPAPRLHRSLT